MESRPGINSTNTTPSTICAAAAAAVAVIIVIAIRQPLTAGRNVLQAVINFTVVLRNPQAPTVLVPLLLSGDEAADRSPLAVSLSPNGWRVAVGGTMAPTSSDEDGS